jgi:hypothetical protein
MAQAPVELQAIFAGNEPLCRTQRPRRRAGSPPGTVGGVREPGAKRQEVSVMAWRRWVAGRRRSSEKVPIAETARDLANDRAAKGSVWLHDT